MPKSYNVKYFSSVPSPAFQCQNQNGYSSFSQTILVLCTESCFVLKVEGCPGQRFRVSFAGWPVEMRGRYLRAPHPHQNFIWKYPIQSRNFIGMPQNEVIIELQNERTYLTFLREGVPIYGLSCATDDIQKMIEQHIRAHVNSEGVLK